MSYWLYQMNVDRFSHKRFRAEVWEGDLTQNWTIGESTHRPKNVSVGDILVFFYAKTVAIEPGIYGWGVVTFFDKETEEMHFRPATPSDYLKMNPLWDDDINKIVDRIRGGMPEGTMFKVDGKELKNIRRKIEQHVFGK
jgi:hypothetical protein